MKLPILIILTTVASLNCAVAQEESPEIAAILKLEPQWCDAYLHVDAGSSPPLARGRLHVGEQPGRVTTKADDLKDAVSGETNYDMFENRDMKVALYAIRPCT